MPELKTQEDFDKAAQEVTQYLMRLEDREMANKIYDLLVALNRAGREFRLAWEHKKEAADQYYQALLDAERHNEANFSSLLVELLTAALAKFPNKHDGVGVLMFFADGSGGSKEDLNNGWNNLEEFVTWLKNQKPSLSEK